MKLTGLMLCGLTAFAGLGSRAGAEPMRNRIHLSGECLSQVVISPVGDRFAAVQTTCHGAHKAIGAKPPPSQVVIGRIDGADVTPVLDSVWPQSLAWSPDGRRLLIARLREWGKKGSIFDVLDPDRDSLIEWPIDARGAVFSPDGGRVAVVRPGYILLVDLTTGDSTALRMEDTTLYPQNLDWSTRGNRLLFTCGKYSNRPYALYTAAIDTVIRAQLIDTAIFCARWCSDGDGIYVLRPDARGKRPLSRIPIDPKTGLQDGAETLLLPSVESYRGFWVTADGRQLIYRDKSISSTIWIYKRQASGAYVKQLLNRYHDRLRSPRISPDGKKLLVLRSCEGPPEFEILIIDLENGRVDSLAAVSNSPALGAWSPDSRHVAYITGGPGACDPQQITVLSIDGGSPVIYDDQKSINCFQRISWAPMPYICYLGQSNPNFDCFHVQEDSNSVLLPPGEMFGMVEIFSAAIISPDGRMAAIGAEGKAPGERHVTGDGIWMIPLSGQAQVQVVAGRYSPLTWSADGEYLYALKSGLDKSFGAEESVCRFRSGSPEPETILDLSQEKDDGPIFESPGYDPWVTMDAKARVVVRAVAAWPGGYVLVDGFDPSVR